MRPRPRDLGSTYRIQLNGVGLRTAAELVDYLHQLGIETLYLSPILAATPGSSHGYDVVDPSRIDPALGTRDDLEALLERLDSYGMRLLLDIVPNHMANSSTNLLWADVLRFGRQSEFARFFDIDWDAGGQKVVLPVLGRPFGEVLEGGEFLIQACEGATLVDHPPAADVKGSLCVRYGDLIFPLATERCEHLIEPAEDWLERLNGLKGDPRSFDTLEELLDAQHYRLCFWELGRYQVNYRRFFDIDGLVGVRVEDPAVYSKTHEFVIELARDRRIAGLRIDHIDGLADPASYLERLNGDLQSVRPSETQPRGRRGPVVLVEKILARDEVLPAWDIDGTTGYEFADLAVAVLTDMTGARLIAELASQQPVVCRDVAIQARRQALDGPFVGKLDRLAALVVELAAADRHGRDLAVVDVCLAIRELTAHMTVYRTYIGADGMPSVTDQVRIDDAAEAARSRISHEPGQRALEVVRRMLLSIPLGAGNELQPGSWKQFTVEWQQLASAVAAKGVEDTGLYRFSGLLSAGDVGSDPGEPTVTVERFHRGIRMRSSEHPGGLNATSTHDSKRSEDTRSRLAVLSEIPEIWTGLVHSWRLRHADLAGDLSWGGQTMSDLDLSLYQTIVGVWPLQADDHAGLTTRVQEYMLKAEREAKLRTSWAHPDESFEGSLHTFVDRILDPANHQFHQDVESLVEDIGRAGAVNSLALLILKVAAPGVPDFYQGTEVWNPLLVDPDNRRPVDFERLRRLWSLLPSTDRRGNVDQLVTNWRDGAIKMFVMREALTARRADPELFGEGEYLPLEARGRWSSHLVAFARRLGDRWAFAVVPRKVMTVVGPRRWPIGGAWADTEILVPAHAPDVLTDVFGQGSVRLESGTMRVADILSVLPISLLIG